MTTGCRTGAACCFTTEQRSEGTTDFALERGGSQIGGFWHQYDVSSDGTRFLVNTLVDAAAAAGPRPILPITVIVNWTAALQK